MLPSLPCSADCLLRRRKPSVAALFVSLPSLRIVRKPQRRSAGRWDSREADHAWARGMPVARIAAQRSTVVAPMAPGVGRGRTYTTNKSGDCSAPLEAERREAVLSVRGLLILMSMMYV